MCLLGGSSSGSQVNLVAVILAAAATVFISRGTVESGKNLKWLTLSLLSFVASLVSFALLSGQEYIDERKAYEFKIKLLVWGRIIQQIWGGILAVFVMSRFMAPADLLDPEQKDGSRKHR